MRQGMLDPRGALTTRYVELADAVDHVRTARGEDECVIVWENVPGVLSDKGNAFGCFLGALVGESEELRAPGERWRDAGCVYGPKRTVAWRVLDAQYFGLAQRRRRVFVVASARRGFDPCEVLFEREGVRRDTAPRRGEGQDLTGQAPFGPALQCECGCTFEDELGPWGCPNCEGDEGPAVSVIAGVPAFGGENQQALFRAGSLNAHGLRNDFASETFLVHEAADDAHDYLVAGSCARRLTEIECERLQGFPDDYTRTPYRGKPAEDCPAGPRYKAIGNSKAVPVVRWIGQRIKQQIDASFNPYDARLA
jgi:DNA (cytosine-5)-methyltransferase 1